MDEWTSFYQVAFKFMASNYRRNHAQRHREYADNRNRRHKNLQPNLRYIAHVGGLPTILNVDTFVDFSSYTSNHLLHFEDTESRQTTTFHSEKRYQRSKDILLMVTQNEKAYRMSSRTSKEHKLSKHASNLSTSTHIWTSKEHFDHSADYKKQQSAFE